MKLTENTNNRFFYVATLYNERNVLNYLSQRKKKTFNQLAREENT